jgi:ATP-dependent Lon protease
MKMKKAVCPDEVPVDELRWQCDPKSLGFKSTDELKPSQEIIGQVRAVNALRLGLDIESPGYNVFVTGPVGTGRKTAITRLLKTAERPKKMPDDKLYVNNFRNPDMPILIRLPAGQGRRFKKSMARLVEYLSKNVPAIFESEEYQSRKKGIVEKLKSRERRMFKGFEKEVAKKGFALIQVQIGPIAKPAVVPVIEDQPVNFDQLRAMIAEGKMSKEKARGIEEEHSQLADRMTLVLKKMHGLEEKARDKVKSLDDEIVKPLVEDRISEMREKFGNDKVNGYLDEVTENVLENLGRFQNKQGSAQGSPQVPDSDQFLEYSVNLLVDNHGAKRAPVIFEMSPTYRNLFGTLEVTQDRAGHWLTDFTKIKPGSILRADGGYLIIEALDTLTEPGVWQTLKRTLRNRKVEIQNYAPFYMVSVSALKPEPIICDIKVAMVGDAFLYHLLYEHDEDFKKIFKVRAAFDSVMDVSHGSVAEYCNLAKKIVSNEGLKPFDNKAVARIIEYGVRLAGKQSKLSTEFNYLADILREANYWAAKAGSSKVKEKHVQKAVEEKRDRSKLIEEKIQEMIEEGTIMIDTRGAVVGQVNGLAVYDTGDYSFGRPSRITAKASVGESGIINIEREADLSGRLHSKGVLILAGYLRSMYSQDKPLTVSASLCFEQSYSGVEGDSASSTEIYALMSALSELPIRQDMAVTGSVNQKGEIQPIGGVNQKIEGFYAVCKAKGLTGKQGVMIPHQNLNDLMLHKDVTDAVRRGKFHVYAVKTIDQGVEILTGIKAGKRKKGSGYEPGTVNCLVDEKLLQFADTWRDFKTGGSKEE